LEWSEMSEATKVSWTIREAMRDDIVDLWKRLYKLSEDADVVEQLRAQKAHYSTMYDRVRAAERRGGHGIQTRDEFGELRRQYRKDWQRLCKPIPRGRPKKEVER